MEGLRNFKGQCSWNKVRLVGNKIESWKGKRVYEPLSDVNISVCLGKSCESVTVSETQSKVSKDLSEGAYTPGKKWEQLEMPF